MIWKFYILCMSVTAVNIFVLSGPLCHIITVKQVPLFGDACPKMIFECPKCFYDYQPKQVSPN